MKRDSQALVSAVSIILTIWGSSTNAVEVAESVVCSGEVRWPVEVKTEATAAYAPDGSLVVVWSDYRRGVGGDLLGARASAGGPFSKPVRLSDYPVQGEPNWGWNRSMASIAIGPDGNVYVAWMDRRPGTPEECPLGWRCHTSIRLVRSRDGGSSWSPSARPSDRLSRSQSQPAVVVSDDGRLHAVWTDNGDFKVYYRASDDEGLSWLRPSRPVAASPDDQRQLDPAIAVRGSTVVIAYSAKDHEQEFNVVALFSFDGGETFSEPVRVDSGASRRSNRSAAVAIADTGTVYVLWQGIESGSSTPDIFGTYVEAGGTDFGPPVRVNDDDEDLPQVRPGVVVDSLGRVLVVFEDYRNGLGDPDIYLTRTVTMGGPLVFEPNEPVDHRGAGTRERNPAVAISPVSGEVAVIWERARSTGGVDILRAVVVD